jgi:hypothetical protein
LLYCPSPHKLIAGHSIQLQATTGFKSIHSWHHDVQQNQVGLNDLGPTQAALTTFCRGNVEAMSLQMLNRNRQIIRIIIDD